MRNVYFACRKETCEHDLLLDVEVHEIPVHEKPKGGRQFFIFIRGLENMRKKCSHF